jgi:hypothetical protein
LGGGHYSSKRSYVCTCIQINFIAFSEIVPYVHDYITKLCRQLAEVIKMQLFAILDKAKPDAGNVRGLNLAAVKHTII